MLSVIVPAHNRGEELEQALTCLSIQTFKRFITVVINDASTEDLSKIFEKFYEKLNLVVIDLKVNGGPAKARQAGLDWAIKNNMELVMFMDSDDLIAANTVQRLTYEINHTNANAVFSTIIRENDEGVDSFLEPEKSITWMHGKIYRLSAIKQLKLSFNLKLRTNEDINFNLKFYSLIDRETIKLVNEPFYIWRKQRNSITHSAQHKHNVMTIDYIDAVYDAAKTLLPYNKFSSAFIQTVINIYNYHQTYMIIDKNAALSKEVLSKIKFLLNLPFFEKIMKKPKKILQYFDFVKHYMMTEDEFYWFNQTFYDWYRQFK